MAIDLTRSLSPPSSTGHSYSPPKNTDENSLSSVTTPPSASTDIPLPPTTNTIHLRGPNRYSQLPYNKPFILSVVEAALNLDPEDNFDLFDRALTGVHDNIHGRFHKQFDTLQGITKPGPTSQSSILDVWNNSALTDLFQQIAPPGSMLSVQDIRPIIQGATLIHAFAFESKKSIVLERISRWMALLTLSGWYSWCTGRDGCRKLAEEVTDKTLACHNSLSSMTCTCSPSPFARLGHCVLDFLLNVHEQTDQTVPQDVLKDLFSQLKAPYKQPLTVYFDLNPKSSRSTQPPSASSRMMRGSFMSLLPDILAQILIYPHLQIMTLSRTINSPIPLGSNHRENCVNLRNFLIAAGGVCHMLQHAFGSSLIFSLSLKGQWDNLLRDPVQLLFPTLKETASRGTTSLAASLLKDHERTVGGIALYVGECLGRTISKKELFYSTVSSIVSLSPTAWVLLIYMNL
jgi:hypothetical protein